MLLIDVPNFTPQKESLAIIFFALISFLAFIWASRKTLYLLQISDFGISMQIKQDERKAKAIRERGKIKTSFLKINATKQEINRRKKLYKVKKERYKTQEAKAIKRLEKRKASFLETKNRIENIPLSQRIPKTTNSKSTNGKRTQRKEFMSKKYRETFNLDSNGDKRKDFMSKKYRDTFNVDINGNKI